MTFKFISVNDSLRLRVIFNRKKFEINLGYRISKETLDNVLSERTLAENTHWKKKIFLLRAKCEELANAIGDIDKDADIASVKSIFKSALTNGGCTDKITNPSELFMPFMDKVMNSRRTKGYRQIFHYTVDKIKEFDENHAALTFNDITLKWLTDFDEWLANTAEASKSSRNIHFRNIRTVMNRAIDEELTTNYPFRRFKIQTVETRKRSMTVDALRTIFTCEVEEYQEYYRDIFKLIFMLIGINAADLYALKEITPDGRIEYQRAKTGRLYSIKVEPEAMRIIEKHKGINGLLDISDRWNNPAGFLKYTNIALKKIGKMERMPGRGGKKKITPLNPELSTYWARHTWATIASELDISKDVIAHALGHGSKTVTDVYIDFNQKKVDDANRKVLDYVLYPWMSEEE